MDLPGLDTRTYRTWFEELELLEMRWTPIRDTYLFGDTKKNDLTVGKKFNSVLAGPTCSASDRHPVPNREDITAFSAQSNRQSPKLVFMKDRVPLLCREKRRLQFHNAHIRRIGWGCRSAGKIPGMTKWLFG